MNVVKLCGGLGNQMFQYAFGKALQKVGNRTLYNIQFYQKIQDPQREFNLTKFKVDVHIAKYSNARIVRERLFKSIDKIDNCNFHGYWQHPKYYQSVLSELKEEFQVKPEFYTPEFIELKDQILNSESIGVHVRHGDYVTKNSCYVLPFSYYVEALTKVEGELFIFSDDIEWCRKMFTMDYFNRKITFVHLADYLDFELMRLCKNKIIANSTFSLWTALLDGGVVIAPKLWRVKKNESQPTGLNFEFPKDWILC